MAKKNTIKKEVITPFMQGLKSRVMEEISESFKELGNIVDDHMDAHIAAQGTVPVIKVSVFDKWRNDVVLREDISFQFILDETFEIYDDDDSEKYAVATLTKMIDMIQKKIKQVQTVS